MIRYSVIHDKNPREIVLLTGTGCRWKKCVFCDYHLDSSPDAAENFRKNREVLQNVTGCFRHLEVINSGSFPELDADTMAYLTSLCRNKSIQTLHFECHWLYRKQIPALRARFKEAGTVLKIKTGVETFDYDFREKFLHKGIAERDPAKIAENFDECCLLFGLPGQTAAGMKKDVETGLAFFERVCVNIFTENTAPLRPDPHVIGEFTARILPLYRENPRVDILMRNTDFGVGSPEVCHAK